MAKMREREFVVADTGIRLNDNDDLIGDIQQKKAELIKRKSNRDRRTNRNEKIVKQNQSELKNKQLTLEEIISSSNDKKREKN